MKCPECYADVADVIDSRKQENGEVIRRRRECRTCGHRYTSYEIIATPEEFELMVKVHLPKDKRVLAVVMSVYKEAIEFAKTITAMTKDI